MTIHQCLKSLHVKQQHLGFYAVKLAVEAFQANPEDFCTGYYEKVLTPIATRLKRSNTSIANALLRASIEAFNFDNGITVREVLGVKAQKHLKPKDFIIAISDVVDE